MKRTFAFRRVYWSGAAWALSLDVRLRRERGLSLDAAIVGARPHFPHGTRWSGRALARALDTATDTTFAVPLFDAYADRHDFPDTDALLTRLGVHRGRDGAFSLVDDAPLVTIRRAISATVD
jgi:hypothetical protein